MMVVAIPFTSRYLAMVEPDIVALSSATILGTIMKDNYAHKRYWESGNSAIDIVVPDFYAETNSRGSTGVFDR